MVMRWKILALAAQHSSLDGLLKELKQHPEYGLPEDSELDLLSQYSDILPQALQDELRVRTSPDSLSDQVK